MLASQLVFAVNIINIYEYEVKILSEVLSS